MSLTNAQMSVAALTLADGSTLDIASYTPGTVPMAVTTLNLPASGAVNLTLGGGTFRKGVYEIYARQGVTAADGEKFAPSTGGETVAWSVEGDKLILTVGTLADGFWTGLGGDGKMSTGANWANRVVPGAGTDLDFSGVLSATTIAADAGVTYGAVTHRGNLSLANGACLGFNFTEKTAAPTLAASANVSLPATVTVKISSADGVRPKSGTYVLTSFGGFDAEDVTVQLAADVPDWVKSLSVNDDGNLELAVKRKGFTLIVK